jgi:hypothetical protein
VIIRIIGVSVGPLYPLVRGEGRYRGVLAVVHPMI